MGAVDAAGGVCLSFCPSPWGVGAGEGSAGVVADLAAAASAGSEAGAALVAGGRVGGGDFDDGMEMTEERQQAEALANELAELFGRRLISVLLYGSAARGDYRAGTSNLNVLVVLERVDLDSLRRLSTATRAWIDQGNPPPLILSEAEWLRSADVFPIEYTDIREAHILLAGRDPFERMRIHREHLRLQLEHELRGKKIQLREAYVVAGDSPNQLGDLLLRSVPTFLTLFRAMLRLASKPVPRNPDDLVFAAASEIGFSADAVVEAVRIRQAGSSVAVPLDSPLAEGYLEAIERAVRWLDGFKGETGGGELV